jgi:hypothetical protein
MLRLRHQPHGNITLLASFIAQSLSLFDVADV